VRRFVLAPVHLLNHSPSQEITNPQPINRPPTILSTIRTASISLFTRPDELLGNVEAGYDPETKKIMTSNRARVIEARNSYQKALDVLSDTVEKSKVSPISAEDQMNALESKLAECNVLLRR